MTTAYGGKVTLRTSDLVAAGIKAQRAGFNVVELEVKETFLGPEVTVWEVSLPMLKKTGRQLDITNNRPNEGV